MKSQNTFLKNRFGDLTGKLCYENYMGLDSPCSFCKMKKVISDNSVEKVELTGADGRDYELTSALLPKKEGAPTRVVEVVQDITERKAVERKLLKEIAFNKTILDSTPAYFVSIDKQGKLIDINKKIVVDGYDYRRGLVFEFGAELFDRRCPGGVLKALVEALGSPGVGLQCVGPILHR